MLASTFVTGLALAASTDLAPMLLLQSGDDSSLWLFLLGPAAGIGFYTMIYLRYRNTDKRFEYEHKTSSDIADVQGYDRKIRTVRGVENPRIRGDLSRDPRKRLGERSRIELH
ncbi:MAG: hypothetical protein GXX90_07800 [Microbacteriaceae bacterium]|nr:hypothetical protein [Microbacteriaceae bacterium]